MPFGEAPPTNPVTSLQPTPAAQVTPYHPEPPTVSAGEPKIFICRLAGSKDCEAKKRRTRIFVDVLLRGLLEMDGLSPRERLSIRLGLASARFWIGSPLAQPATRAIEMFGKHYMRAQDSSQRARFVDLICKAFDEALNAGKQGR